MLYDESLRNWPQLALLRQFKAIVEVAKCSLDAVFLPHFVHAKSKEFLAGLVGYVVLVECSLSVLPKVPLERLDLGNFLAEVMLVHALVQDLVKLLQADYFFFC